MRWLLIAALAVACVLLISQRKARFDSLVVGQSGTIPGTRGVFAARPFAKGEVVERCPAVKQANKHARGNINNYLFDIGGGVSVVALGFGSLYNHGRNPHLEYEYDRKRNEIVFTAIRPIRAGEEIFVSYGKEWWKSRGWQPK